jgi:hypothetical protein
MWRWVEVALFMGALLLSGACSANKMMSYGTYQNVPLGQSVAELQVQVGKPYEVITRSDGTQEYVYIERISLGEDRSLFRRYIFVVENDQIIQKKSSEERSNSLHFYNY